MSTRTADDARPDVAGILERLRLAEAKLARQREQQTGMNESDRAAMRYLLERVDTEEITPGIIAHALHLSPASGTALIDRLVARGLVVVGNHPRDRRKKLVRPFDRNVDPDHLDPLTTRLRTIADGLTTGDARIVAGFLEDVLSTVTHATAPAA
ncbi:MULTISPECIES: MarR family transcriptional regulator [Microbacterium]|uniref:MarR family winged helix-turn-helix transcriptional regulator n=1 Tax=Microbacterium TaxID=33882 RepID=UPI000D6585E4|nr:MULTISPECIES: MarR family transcriptional regulator [Microbacterium]